jgi:hypothetical protein
LFAGLRQVEHLDFKYKSVKQALRQTEDGYEALAKELKNCRKELNGLKRGGTTPQDPGQREAQQLQGRRKGNEEVSLTL